MRPARGDPLRSLKKSHVMLLSIANPAFRNSLYHAVKRAVAYIVGSVGEVRSPVPSLLLNTLPKSGSVFMMHTLSETLGCGRLHLGNMYSLIDQVSLEKMQAFSKGGWVAQDHLAPSLENLQILQHFGCAMVLHVRDPRQAMVSWLHHLDRVYREQGEEPLLLVAPRPPSGYFTWDFTNKIDWQIDHYLPQVIDWLVRWLAVHDSGEIPILLTDYGELSGDAGRLCRRICRFYGIAVDGLHFVDIPKTIANHFRLADDEEWLRVLDPAQIERVNALLPVELACRFGWLHTAARDEEPIAYPAAAD
jgi:hypothetical protein